ncbi:hypothetical protein RhiJN_24488 [Ceratobasidium sp. AG-Ba]|nr:hypothetical protein RhiJN_24488 [Ceratobasidium sp. AG-Ba]
MSGPPTSMAKTEFRIRIREIKLEPDRSDYDIKIGIQLDNKTLHKFTPIKKGAILCWTDLRAPCDVYEGAEITIVMTEVHVFRGNHIFNAKFSISESTGQEPIKIGCEDPFRTVEISFVDTETAKQAYTKALEKVKETQRQPGLIERTGKIRDAFGTLLALGNTVAELDPTGGAKVAFSVCTMALQQFKEQEKRAVALNALVDGLARLKPSVESVSDIADANLRETVTKIMNLIEDASVFVLNSRPQDWLGTVKDAYSSETQEQAALFITEFESLRKEFNMRVGVQQLRTLELEKIRARLKELKPAHLASFVKDKQCLDGTRTEIIGRLESWADSKEGPSLLWMYGVAGLGKSSIATSVSKKLHDRGVLAASFFCNRDSPDLRDPRKVLVTIVRGLAQVWEEYAKVVVKIMQDDINLDLEHLAQLYDTLIAAPLQALATKERPPKALVIVVDALDECGKVASRKQLLTYLSEITRLVSGIRILVTSRPNDDIRTYFKGVASGSYKELNVHDYDASEDIQTFTRESLSKSGNIEEPLDEVADRVSKLAAGSFIWARTACAYIRSRVNPDRRLNLLTGGVRLSDIDALYKTILTAEETLLDEENTQDMLACLGPIIATSIHSPLPIDSLASLLYDKASRTALRRTVEMLSSVLYTDERLGGAVRVLHPSFMDYITDSSRSETLCVDLDSQNKILAECCLRTMLSNLRFNISELNTSYYWDIGAATPGDQANMVIERHLAYSCVYWASHASQVPIDNLNQCLRMFLFGRELLYWLEALSVLGKLGVAPSSLSQIAEHCTTEQTKECGLVANDAYRFVLSFYDAISQSPPHIYITALALSPSNSRISKRMRAWFPNLLAVVENGDDEWSPCIRAITAPAEVKSVSLSSKGKTIIAGLRNRTIQTWDAATGDAVLAPFQGHSDSVTCVAVSPDGRHVVSGSKDMTLRVWDAQTGGMLLGPLSGHTRGVHAVAYSSDSRKIASGSWDKTVRIWDALTGEPVGDPPSGEPLEYPQSDDPEWVPFVMFSPDNHRVLSSSDDMTIRLSDAQKRTQILKPFKNHDYSALSAVFSPSDDLRIASGSYDRAVRVWSSEAGEELTGPLTGHSDKVMSVVFSFRGDQIVSGSMDGTVCVWDAHSGALMLGPFTGHLSSINSVAISEDGKRIVSGSDDKTIRIWDTALTPSTTATQIPSTAGHSDVISSVAFSPNCRFVASGSADNTVCIWDARTGRMVLGPLEGHSEDAEEVYSEEAEDVYSEEEEVSSEEAEEVFSEKVEEVYSVAYSPGGSCVASGSADGTVRIWDVNTGSLAVQPLRGHSSSVAAVTFSPDGTLLASSSFDKTVRIWGASTGAAVTTLTGLSGYVRCVAFSPDSKRIVSGSDDRTIRVWDVETGRTVVGPMKGHSKWVLSVAFSPDGHHIASGSRDNTIRVWDAQTGQQVLEPLEGHSYSVNCVTYSHDGQRIISCSADDTIRIWDAKTGQPVLEPLQGHSSSVESVAVSSDGRYIVSGSGDNTIRLWDASPYLTSTLHPVRHLPGTDIRTLHTEDDRMLVTSAELARHLDPDSPGWVTTEDGKPLLWLPPELRGLDEMCISATGVRRRVVIDFSRFVHGKDWTKVMEEYVGERGTRLD